MLILILFGALAVFVIIGLPVALSLAGASLVYVLVAGQVPGLVVVHRMVAGVDSFPLLAVPFFILAGNLMNSAGITARIFAFAQALVGWMRGGLGHVNVGASVLFAGMSGAAVADAGGLGAIEIRAMRDAGYDTDFAIGITASSSTIGPLIPPSLPMVIYGVLASASIGQLFAAGVIPGLLMAVALMVMVNIYARRRGYARANAFSLCVLWTSFRAAALSLITPAIIIGGILFGIMTPTEAAIAAVAWAMFLGMVVYRNLPLRALYRVSLASLETTVVIMFVISAASIFSWVLTQNRVPQEFAALISELTNNRFAILILINLILFVVGCFMETVAAITILVPVLLPLAVAAGVDPVQFGVIMVLNLMLGLLTPPVGMVLYILAKVSDVSFETTARATMPFILPLLVVLALVTFIPAVSMWLPTLLYR
ncbi:TRAP transporter large permease [Puniceibacterium sp. IMCC21224]|uniref:TRAP transporter large permease n=1 Tax=Puniceibacterium sp. IMCC21224 TaxID=1618204 RepID=UPI00064E07B6|nr:TRAP transporter large permease [Puniceibacterium sp. IMCC21224]KMK64969.1 TRAP transporter, DctM subunit [Puniceibacterium sp. IMCC21224]